jgi:hypothetical protein
MDGQQLTHPEEIQWYERQKQLSQYLDSEEPAKLAMALQLFLDQHAQLHSTNGLAQSALAGLSDEQWRLKPGQGTNSVAWLLLHMARIEDVTFNLLVKEKAQVFDEWFEQLGFDRRGDKMPIVYRLSIRRTRFPVVIALSRSSTRARCYVLHTAEAYTGKSTLRWPGRGRGGGHAPERQR